jgi:hypothetical protein
MLTIMSEALELEKRMTKMKTAKWTKLRLLLHRFRRLMLEFRFATEGWERLIKLFFSVKALQAIYPTCDHHCFLRESCYC